MSIQKARTKKKLWNLAGWILGLYLNGKFKKFFLE